MLVPRINLLTLTCKNSAWQLYICSFAAATWSEIRLTEFGSKNACTPWTFECCNTPQSQTMSHCCRYSLACGAPFLWGPRTCKTRSGSASICREPRSPAVPSLASVDHRSPANAQSAACNQRPADGRQQLGYPIVRLYMQGLKIEDWRWKQGTTFTTAKQGDSCKHRSGVVAGRTGGGQLHPLNS